MTASSAAVTRRTPSSVRDSTPPAPLPLDADAQPAGLPEASYRTALESSAKKWVR